MEVNKLLHPSKADFFLCQLYLFDRDAWQQEVLRNSPSPKHDKTYLYICGIRIRRVIQYYESYGFTFSPPAESLWITAGRMAELVESGNWLRFRGLSGYPSSIPASA